MARRLIMLALMFLPSLLLGAGCSRTVPAASDASDGERVVTPMAVAYVRLGNGGKATVTRGGTWVAAVDDAVLQAGDEVTVNAGTVTLIYPGTGASLLQEGSVLRIVSDAGAKGLFMRLMLKAGSVWTRLERLLGADEHLSVSANNVVATVRGTAFGVVAGVSGDVAVTTVEHAVAVSPAEAEEDPSRTVTVSIGQVLSVTAQRLQNEGAQAVLKTALRRSTAVERQGPGHGFAQTPIPPAFLRGPALPIELSLGAPDQAWLIEQVRAVQAAQAKRRAIDLEATFRPPDRPPEATDLPRSGQVLPRGVRP